MKDSDWAPGKRYENYQLLKAASGGKGVFWLVWDTQERTLKGLKVLKTQFTGPGEILKYGSETILGLFLPEHPGVSRFYESRIDAGRIINVIEYLPGRTLYETYVGEHSSATVASKIAYILQVLEALEHLIAHFKRYPRITGIGTEGYQGDMEFYHGDLHSENIILTPDGRAVLIDWGQSYRLGRRKYLYPSISPEFHEDSPFRDYRGSRTDVYALGVLLWHLFEGRPPWGKGGYREEGTQIELEWIRRGAKSDAHNPPRRLRDIDGSLPDYLLKMLSYDPYQRPSLSEVKEYLRSIRESGEGDFLYVKMEHRKSPSALRTTAASLLEVGDLISAEHKEAKLKALFLHLKLLVEYSDIFPPDETLNLQARILRFVADNDLLSLARKIQPDFELHFSIYSEGWNEKIEMELEAIFQQSPDGHALKRELCEYAKISPYAYDILITMFARLGGKKPNDDDREFLAELLDEYSERPRLYGEFFKRFRRRFSDFESFAHAAVDVHEMLLLVSIIRMGKDWDCILTDQELSVLYVKFLEWGYDSSGSYYHLRKVFRDLYGEFDRMFQNSTARNAPGAYRVTTHCLSFELVRLRHYVLERDESECLACIKRLKKRLARGRLPYLDLELCAHFMKVERYIQASATQDANMRGVHASYLAEIRAAGYDVEKDYPTGKTLNKARIIREQDLPAAVIVYSRLRDELYSGGRFAESLYYQGLLADMGFPYRAEQDYFIRAAEQLGIRA